MKDSDLRPLPSRNHYLISMVVVGALSLHGGALWAAVSYRFLNVSSYPNPLLALGISAGSSLSGLGLLLLLIAWTIAAARHR